MSLAKLSATGQVFAEFSIIFFSLSCNLVWNLIFFFQTNPKSAERLYTKAIDYVCDHAKDGGVIMDLFCGTGTIGQLVAQRVGPVLLASAHIEQRVADLCVVVEELAGRTFNLDSPKQLGALLFDELGLNAKLKTPTGAPSTNEEALEAIADQHELPRVILEYRGLAKLRSTYTDKLPEMVNPDTGRVHTSYHQAGAATGRLSSNDPNLQNIPIRTEDGRRIRTAFIAPDGRVFGYDSAGRMYYVDPAGSGTVTQVGQFASGYTGSDAVARTLSVPPFSGDTPAQLQSRFIDCLFTRG